MTTRTIALFLLLALATAHAAQTITFEPPKLDEGKTLMEALSLRQSTRSFKEDDIDNRHLGDLLWATWGYNRQDKRTAPTAINRQELSVYIIRKDGVWLYNAREHSIISIVEKDLRSIAGMQPFVEKAPVNLIFVADSAKADEEFIKKFAAVDAAFCAQNAALYCASVGLGGVVRASYPADKLHKEMELSDTQSIVLAMSIGWPAVPFKEPSLPMTTK